MTTAHTATPFIAKGREVLCLATGHTICEVPSRDIERARIETEFIVRACNAHDDLVNALQRVVRYGDLLPELQEDAIAALAKAGAA